MSTPLTARPPRSSAYSPTEWQKRGQPTTTLHHLSNTTSPDNTLLLTHCTLSIHLLHSYISSIRGVGYKPLKHPSYTLSDAAEGNIIIFLEQTSPSSKQAKAASPQEVTLQFKCHDRGPGFDKREEEAQPRVAHLNIETIPLASQSNVSSNEGVTVRVP